MHKPTTNRIIVRPADNGQTLRDGDIILDGAKVSQVDYCEGCGAVAYNDVTDTPLEAIARDANRWYNVAVNQLRDEIDEKDAQALAEANEASMFCDDMMMNAGGL
jgi:hypothetical protein